MPRQDRFAYRFACASLAIAALCAGSAVAVVTFDGQINFGPGQEWGNAQKAVQDNFTQFGNQQLVPGSFPGSELDELFVRMDANFLYLGITGNLEQSGNSQIILLDVRPGGQNVLKTEIAPVATEMPCSQSGPPNAVQGLGQALQRANGGTPNDPTDDVTARDPASTGTTLDAGFEPDYALSINTNGGTLFVDQYDLFAASQGQWDDPTTGQPNCATPPGPSKETLDYFATRTFRGSNIVNGGTGILNGGVNPNASLFAYNNTGKLGVTGASDTPPPTAGSGQPGDPRSQTTGLEARISWKGLGFTTPINTTISIKISVLLTSGDGFVSNQTLPGIGAGTSIASLGYRPDFTAIAGDQFVTVTKTTAQFSAPGGTINGANIVSDFGATNVVASQNTVTGFGDRNCKSTSPGSELDELFLRTDGQFLYVGVTGNLQDNSNAQILLLDILPGGQNLLHTEITPDTQAVSCPVNGPPWAVPNLGQALTHNPDTGARERSADGTVTVLDTGFEPETAITIGNTGGTLFVNQYTLSATVLGQWDDPETPNGGGNNCSQPPHEALDYFATRTFRGQTGINTTGGILTGGFNPNGSLYAFNNTGKFGVTGTAVAAPGSNAAGDPRTQITGWEAKISLLDLGFTPEQLPLAGPLNVKASVLLTSADGFVSSQTLPGTNNGVGGVDLGNRPDFTTISGNQYATASLTPGAVTITIDGQNIVSEFGVDNVIASQNTVTSFGDAVEITVTDCDQQLQPGSELDQLLLQESIDTIQIGITGNLETNGNNIVVFLDTAPGGEQTLDGNAGRITGMNGDKLPMAAEWAIVMNTGGGQNIWIDLVNLLTNQSTFIGFKASGSGAEGILDGCGGTEPDCQADWRISLNNTNVLGVNSNATDDPVQQIANALTATTGIELSVSKERLGGLSNGSSVCAWAILTSGDGGFHSNQVIPAGIGGGRNSFGNGPTNFGDPPPTGLGYSCLPLQLGPVCNEPRYDADGDGDVDSDDFGRFQACYTGAGGSPESPLYNAADCACFDWNLSAADGDVDQEDVGFFQLCASGPHVPADADCDDPLDQ